MPLKVIDTGNVWNGERVRGVLYTREIEAKLTDEELLERGFQRFTPEPVTPPSASPVVPTEGTEDI